jgi:hypothetical protein
MIVAVTENAGDQAGSEAWHGKLEQLPHVSAAERRQIIDDYLATVFRDVPPQLQARARRSLPGLPEHPAPGQVSAWLDAARYFRGPRFPPARPAGHAGARCRGQPAARKQ